MVHVTDLGKHYGNKILYRGGSFQINPGEKIGLVGPNGAGKTTIFRILSGQELPDEGRVARPDRLKIGYFSQEIAEMSGRTVMDEVRSAVGDLPRLRRELNELEHHLADPNLGETEMTQLLTKYGEIQSKFEDLGGYEIDAKISEILTGLGIPPEDHERPTESFSGGWKMRIALAKILAIQPDLLLMDEPTNHLDMESILWLESWLSSFPGSVLMTSHDRDFMNRLVTKVIEIAHQTIAVYSGNYDFYERERAIRREQLVASAKRQEQMLAKEQEFIARFAARASHAAQVQSRVKKLEKIDRIEIPTEEKAMDFEWPVPARGGDEVVVIDKLGKTWPHPKGEKLVFRGASAMVKRLDRIAVVGVNGAGKSTLLKIIVGQADPSEGRAAIGASIKVGYFSQSALDTLRPENTALEEVQSRMPLSNIGTIRNLLGAFKFSGDDADKRVAVLSGGEKSRLILATILAQAPNFLVLDEPTNHLDIQSREVLLEAIKNFPGTVMIVSHDRYFLREIATRVFELDRHELRVINGDWKYYIEKTGGVPGYRDHE